LMHLSVKIAHTPDGVLNDPLAGESLAKVKHSTEAAAIVGKLLDLQAIFDTDLPANADFRAALLEKFVALAKNPAVATAAQISV